MRAIFKIGGVGVYIHWTFWLLVALYVFSATSQAGIVAGIYAAAFVLSVFGCVLLHEFGHSAAAAYYKIRTLDITLLPFGGVARLESLPQKPVQELVIAVAGPAVNVAIAAVLFMLLVIAAPASVAAGPLGPTVVFGSGFIDRLLVVNVFLVLFNLLPAFPMDGGRVLRSLLAMRTGNLRATEIAAGVGRWMALAFSVVAIFYWQFSLLLVAGFVYIAGTAELMQVRLRAAASGLGGQGSASPLNRYTGARPFTSQFRSAGDGDDGAQPTGRNDIVDAIEVRTIRD